MSKINNNLSKFLFFNILVNQFNIKNNSNHLIENIIIKSTQKEFILN